MSAAGSVVRRACRNDVVRVVSPGMVISLIPATLLGLARIGAAVALHEGSTPPVVANALRLLVFKDGRTRP